MSGRVKVAAKILLAWFALPTVQLAALGAAATQERSLAQSTVSPLGALGEPVVMVLLGLLLATVGILARRSSEKRVALKSPQSRDV